MLTRPDDPAFTSRQIARAARKAALATLDAETGAPYASLVSVATAMDAAPVILISTLARHTQNLTKNAQASLLFEMESEEEDVLAGGRVSLMGTMARTDDAAHRRRFLARHPSAAGYAGFKDFAFYAMEVREAHHIGGFGRIHTISGDEYRLDDAAAALLAESEEGAAAHMNEDHADAVAVYATGLLGQKAGDWRFAGCDAEGADLVCGHRQARLVFPEPVTAPGELRKVLAALAREGRAAQAG